MECGTRGDKGVQMEKGRLFIFGEEIEKARLNQILMEKENSEYVLQ